MRVIQSPACAGLFTAALAFAVSFAPLDEWKSAVISGDPSALARVYSTAPPAQVQVGKVKTDLTAELRFWAELKSAGVTVFNPKVLEIIPGADQTRVLLRIQAIRNGQPIVASMVQLWAHQADGWRIVASRRSDFSAEEARRLPQPAIPNPDLYPPPQDAEIDLQGALRQAAASISACS